jgi:hypothetical protein
MPNTRTLASRQTAKASGSSLSRVSPLAMRSLNSPVLAWSAEPGGQALQLVVGERLHLRLEGVDLLDDAAELLEQAFVAATEKAGEQGIQHGSGFSGGCAPGAPHRAWHDNENGRRAPVRGSLV